MEMHYTETNRDNSRKLSKKNTCPLESKQNMSIAAGQSDQVEQSEKL